MLCQGLPEFHSIRWPALEMHVLPLPGPEPLQAGYLGRAHCKHVNIKLPTPGASGLLFRGAITGRNKTLGNAELRQRMCAMLTYKHGYEIKLVQVDCVGVELEALLNLVKHMLWSGRGDMRGLLHSPKPFSCVAMF